MMAARAGLVAILLAGSIASSLWGQRMLTIRERAPSGDTLPIGKSGIVDINGTLLIGINRDSLRTLAEARATSATAISDLLSRLDGVVRVRDAALAAIGPALDRWKASSKDSTAQAMFRDSLHKTSTLAQQVIDAAPRGSRLRDRLNLAFREALTRPGGLEDLYRIVFTVAGDEADALRVERDSLLKAAGVFVQVGGWSITGKGTRPLHFEGFDENPNLEDFEVERFGLGAIALTEQQKQELARIGAVARTFNEGTVSAGLSELTRDIRSAIADAVLPLIDQATACLDQVRSEAEDVIKLPGALAQTARQRVDTTLGPLRDVRASVDALKTKYATSGAAAGQSMSDFLIGTNDDLTGVFLRVESAKTALVTLQGVITELPGLAGSEAARRLRALRTSAETCGNALQVKVTDVRKASDALLQNLLGVRRINADIVAFTDQVLRLDIDRVPESIEFRLRYSGERRDGDKLLVRALLGSAGESAPNREDYELTMFRIQAHLETVVGLVFADPLGSSQVTNRFQAGPSYSVLLKHGSRRSILRNRLLLVGLGINVAALDFNHDDTPELGAGGVISFLGDYLQAGIGYNIPRDRGYWFFGLRLPLPTFTLPGAGGVDTGD